jgi:putative acetyltransferase
MNDRLIVIKPIEQLQAGEAKRLIIGVAERIYKWGKPIDDLIQHFDAEGTFDDLEDLQANYFARGGLFLAATDEGRLIGTGAVRPIDTERCELKRMWLLEQYHGQGIGYRIIGQLLSFVRQAGYMRILLETGVQQERAIHFYQRVGFRIIHSPSASDDLRMEMPL